jgi:hypothetical protein
VAILRCHLRKSICDFVSINSSVSFHPFNPLNAELYPIWHLMALLGAHPILHICRIRVKFYVLVLFVQGYCSIPDFFYKLVVILCAPYWVQSYLVVRVDDCCAVYVIVNLLRLYDLKCFYYTQLFSLILRTPVVLLQFELLLEYRPCKYGYPWSHSLLAHAAVREFMPQSLFAVVFCVVDAEYTLRVEPVP